LVLARDQSVPEKTGTATVRINVVRSAGPPVFINNAPYSAGINVGALPGTRVYTQSRAVDSDLQVNKLIFITLICTCSYQFSILFNYLMAVAFGSLLLVEHNFLDGTTKK